MLLVYLKRYRNYIFTIFYLASLALTPLAWSKGQYYSLEAIIEKTFPNENFEKKTLWIKDDLKKALQKIFGRQSVGLRTRYWENTEKSLWILNEIGKEMPITIAVVVAGGKIESVDVMKYQESRGGEIKNRFFTKQFIGAELNKKQKLSNRIDGITGATLSVKAMRRVAIAALLMQRSVLGEPTAVNGQEKR